MEERTYTQKDIYQLVAEYSKEAQEEGFDISVEDFASWLEFRGAQKEEQGECKKCHCETVKKLDGRVYKYLCPLHQNSLCPECLCNRVAVMTGGGLCGRHTEPEDKPVLPEKLQFPLGGLVIPGEFIEESKKVKVLLGEDSLKIAHKVNDIIDYLCRKEQ